MFRNINISDTKLGKGSYASVFKGTMLHNGKQRVVAVKKIPNDGEHYAASAQKEYDVLSHLKTHKNIIQLLDLKSDEHDIFLIMEYADLGDLEKYVEKNIPDLEDKIQIMLQTASGINYMHSLQPPVIHRDIKPGNILMQSSPQGPVAKICDFGLARIFNPEATSLYMSTDAGTPMYRAPEQFTKGRQQYTSAVDVFSLGLVYMGLLNVSRDKPQIECIPESLYESDMLPYAQYLKIALQHKTPMPALFTLNSADKWPVTELKGIITQMAAFEAADRIKIGDIENKLQIIMSDYGSNTSGDVEQAGDPVNTLLTEVLQDKEEMKQRHEQEKERYEQDKARHEQDKERHEQEKERYEERIREMEEQMALVSQQKPGPSTSLSPPERKEATHTTVEPSSQQPTTTTSQASSSSKSTTVMSKIRTFFKPQKPGPTSGNTKERGPHESKGSGKQTAGKPSSSATVTPPTTPASSSSDKSQLSSFRNNVPSLHRLSGQGASLVNNFKLKKKCSRLCYYDDSIYCCCYSDHCIDVFSVEGGFIRTLALGDISRPRVIHPLSAGRLVLAARSGLYVMGGDGGDITCVKQGSYQDVHVNGSNMVTLKNYDSAHDSVVSDSVCVLSSTAPYTQTATFTLGLTWAITVLLHQDTVYVSDFHTHNVTAYSIIGEQLSQWGGKGCGGPGELYYPLLCATDSSGRVLVADHGNHRLQVVTAGGVWAVVPGVEVEHPTDVLLLTDRMWVLHGNLGRQISVHKLVSG